VSAVIEIEALSIEGYDEAEARRAAASFEATLMTLLERYGLPEGVAAQDLAAVSLPDLGAEADTPEGLGRALARALYREVAQ
jgi:hypothetical protein